jgi:hypothetical protein
MNTLNKKSPAIRLLLTNYEGDEVAVPVNDELSLVSGIKAISTPHTLYERLDYDDTESLQTDKRITTLGSDQGNSYLFVALGIREIFSRVAEAQKAGELLVDLAAESGIEAIAKKLAPAAKAPATRKR